MSGKGWGDCFVRFCAKMKNYLVLLVYSRLPLSTTHWEPRILDTLRLRQICHHFVDIFICIFLNKNVQISLKISLKFVPQVWINSIPTLVQIMACHWAGDKPLSEPVMVSLLMHICGTRPQWVKVRGAAANVLVGWPGTRLWYLWYISNGDTTVLSSQWGPPKSSQFYQTRGNCL